MSKILVTDNLASEALELLKANSSLEVAIGLSEDDLLTRVKDADALLVRSQTQVTARIINAADRLKVIGRAGVGVDNIDVSAATQKGILVINSPGGNTISAAEHTFGLLLAAARKIPQAHQSVCAGEWNRKAFTGIELYNKTLGIIGFGRIGREVATRALAFKMKVLTYDPFVSSEFTKELGVTYVSLDTLLERSDFITLHAPLTPQTENLLSYRQLRSVKPGAYLINCARGGLVDENALVECLDQNILAGAAIDVYREEPPENSPLPGHPKVITTPHLAASTLEAQKRVATDVAGQVLDVLQGLPPRSAVNIPYIPPKELNFLKPYLHLSEKMGSFLHQLCDGALKKVELTYCGELSDKNTSFLGKATLKGLLEHQSPELVNFINAILLAEERGVEITESRRRMGKPYRNLIAVTAHTDRGHHSCAGTVFLESQPRIVEIDGLQMSLEPSGIKLITWQTDQPGVVGKVGTVLGENDINIAEMQVGRKQARTHAVMAMALDERPTPEVLAAIKELEGIDDAKLVVL